MAALSMQVDILSIDTEGHDAVVLRGARKTLQARAATIVEFEHHSVGRWLTESLHDTVQALDAYGYRCFWQGNLGQLASLLPWCDQFNKRKWSNIVCSHHPMVLNVFTSLDIG
jgi:hypothetical protein